MPIAFCSVAAAPVRKLPAHDSEMVNQLLFGEKVQILEQPSNGWGRIISEYDQYAGWVAINQLEQAVTAPADLDDVIIYNTGLVNELQCAAGSIMIPQGAGLPNFHQNKGSLGNLSYAYTGGDTKPVNTLVTDRSFLQAILEKWINVPYLWGGRTFMGVDCSGLTQVVYKMMGVPILRDASQQATQGETVDFLQAAKCGDLAFFDDAEGKIYHVGILLDEARIVHASGRVRIDAIDNAGIIQDGKLRTHQLRIIKRYF